MKDAKIAISIPDDDNSFECNGFFIRSLMTTIHHSLIRGFVMGIIVAGMCCYEGGGDGNGVGSCVVVVMVVGGDGNDGGGVVRAYQVSSRACRCCGRY